MRAVLLVCFLGNAAMAAAQSFTVGDEVVYSGGPSQGPRSIQTGTKFEAQLRGGTPVGGGSVAPRAAPVAPPAQDPPAAPAVPTINAMEDARDAVLAPEPLRRIAAARYLGGVKAPEQRKEALASLQDCLTDLDRGVCCQAAESLGQFGDKAAAPAIQKLLWLNDDQLAVAAMKALGQLKYEAALPDLKKIAESDQGAVGATAREAMAAITAPVKKE
jgi:hypothetical protein